jgi:hypothetical protein
MKDFITGEKFIGLADFVYAPNWKTDCNKIENTFRLNSLFDGAIIYTHTMYVKDLFEILKNVCGKEFILISHNSDTNIDKSYNIPNCIYKWYTTNVNVEDKRIKSIPLGLENKKWFSSINKQFKMMEKLKGPKQIKNLVYCNFDIKTNPIERQFCWDYFNSRCSCWVTKEQGKNGQNFDNYIDQVYSHQFVTCPEGNGIDTVRFWEALYMKSIPIVKANLNTDYFLDLPIYSVCNWDEVSEISLNDWYKKRSNSIKWDNDKLKFSYWENKIKNDE